MKLTCGEKTVDLSENTHIMGVVNCTPDSFYAGSRHEIVTAAVAVGIQMERDGADFLDVGGESSRPGTEPVPLKEELARVIPVIEALVSKVSIPISIDTYKAEVARQSLDVGACIVNDISALRFDPDMANVVSGAAATVILMHIKGKPKDMQSAPSYKNVTEEIFLHLQERIEFAIRMGIEPNKIIVDPGIGFGKRLDDNYEILQRLDSFKRLACPLLVGLSRKSFIQNVLQVAATEALEGTLAANTLAILNGAHILRVHDVLAAKRAATIVDYYLRNAGK